MAYAPTGQSKYGDGEEYELRPPGDLTYNATDAVEAEIVRWRVRCFERYGFSPTVALAMATRRDVDRAQVERLIAEGAAPNEVAGIVL